LLRTAAQSHILQSPSAGGMVKLPTKLASLENVGVDCLACITIPRKVMVGSLVCTRTAKTRRQLHCIQDDTSYIQP